jgi:hypothetical protein
MQAANRASSHADGRVADACHLSNRSNGRGRDSLLPGPFRAAATRVFKEYFLRSRRDHEMQFFVIGPFILQDHLKDEVLHKPGGAT